MLQNMVISQTEVGSNDVTQTLTFASYNKLKECTV